MSIADAEAKQILRYGVISGRAEACGLDWQPHFKALMAHERAKGRTEDQMTYIGVLHGISSAAIKDHPCSASDREKARKAVQDSINQLR
ncbi:MAG: hypothetical protein EAZ74_00060 [Alphaproteobacteria bacterium]|nr:MAG: hypothetical protein EAY76_02395 [Alphaproteobacteria bacterium]TAF16057.1 MAG: hypothetical protein EAZ74_00060 [Alphaproteobacteria bacterium]TAF40638.1 MAG: hypothetical protein EAZ66_02765 [Alphaproteobacteria bacterium]TAF75935.1 MAG: hypothetical protein EAZ52_05575 [Alphaproteobacteria bacterium]